MKDNKLAALSMEFSVDIINLEQADDFLSDAFLSERDAHYVRDADFVCDERLRCI